MESFLLFIIMININSSLNLQETFSDLNNELITNKTVMRIHLVLKIISKFQLLLNVGVNNQYLFIFH